MKLRLGFWKEEAGFYTADKAGLEAAVASCGLPESEISRKMGRGRHLLDMALQGARLTQYEAQHVETGIIDHGHVVHIPTPHPRFPGA